MKSYPTAFVMVDAIKEEVTAAAAEDRTPKSSNVIAIFRRKAKTALSEDQVNVLFDIVFLEYQKLTGAQVAKYGPDGNN